LKDFHLIILFEIHAYIRYGLIFPGKRQTVDGPVAFTAYLSHWENDLAIGQPVAFDTALTNEGGFYNTKTGKFTVPLSGIYMFSFMIETKHAVTTSL
jgi:hypothetical protein